MASCMISCTCDYYSARLQKAGTLLSPLPGVLSDATAAQAAELGEIFYIASQVGRLFVRDCPMFDRWLAGCFFGGWIGESMS